METFWLVGKCDEAVAPSYTVRDQSEEDVTNVRAFTHDLKEKSEKEREEMTCFRNTPRPQGLYQDYIKDPENNVSSWVIFELCFG